MGLIHVPVMYKEVIDYLEPNTKKVIVDCTVGVGSHASLILECMGKGSLYVGIDKDSASLEIARTRLKAHGSKCILIKDDFRNIDTILSGLGVKPDAFFFDLGISSFQLDDPERGFSFSTEGPLDMRMDKDSFIIAYDLVNNLSEKELALIFRKFGEERYSYRIAHCIVQERAREPFATTLQLRDAVVKAIPRKRPMRIHPATRVFMALRIMVNRELDALGLGLEKAIGWCKPRGRVVVISFHSLEDRTTKHVFRDQAVNGKLKILTKKPEIPLSQEISGNRRSRSAKLRAAERV